MNPLVMPVLGAARAKARAVQNLPGLHKGQENFLFADGHVAALNTKNYDSSSATYFLPCLGQLADSGAVPLA